MKLYLVKTAEGNLIPAYDSDRDALRKVHSGEMLKAEITRPRNVRFLKKFFALLKIGFENQEHYNSLESYRKVITMRAGFFETIITEKNGVIYYPKSISFASMDELEFQEVYNSVLDVILQSIGACREDIEEEILKFL